MTSTFATSIPKAQPVPTAITEPYWKSAAEGELWIQRCTECQRCQHYPSGMCRSCWSENVDWIRAAGTGMVWTFTVVSRPGHPAWQPETPYVLALVELDEGPRMMTNIVDCDPSTVHVGQRVRLAPHTAEQPPLQFQPISIRERQNGRTS
ncbi:Zn-ribbon domain-containing OB-fold protein [Mycolicibacterium goodii]|uniref:Zn-ribbon domain-containing OB-fold protein n=1 Tax=Mycolicibacterium goodii TaxID=134601 RepID=UPI001BDD3586|nr:OB-fold domain-containing protein [Mycolicibacterium goodii]MBU8819675.1 OB-fold domain-containing protein [Mycolicibacterium goodii]MBU8833979.1 OB-fold domain-containing protein [Mycolicibacterium goodii]